MLNLSSTDLRRSVRLENKPKQNYGLFYKLSLAVFGACEVAKNPHTFLTISNQHIQETNRHFNGTSDRFVPMVFVTNKKNESYTFKDMLSKPEKSYFILTTMKEFQAYEARNHWTLTKNSEVNNKHKIKMRISRLFDKFGCSSERYSYMKD